MRSFLQRRWFLLLILAGGSLAFTRPSWLVWTRDVDPRFVVAPSLFLTAWGLKSRSLYAVLRRPWPALTATAISYGFLPATAWLAGRVIPGEDFRIGLLIIASVPCTLASALLWTRFAGGNEATALLVILLTTCTSWLATTAWLAAGAGATVAVDSAAMMNGLFLVLVLPVGLGQLLRAFGPLARAGEHYKVPLGVVSRLLILVIILKAATDVRNHLGDRQDELNLWLLALGAGICIGVHLFALAAGYQGSRLLRFSRADAIAVALSGSQKTLPVALFVFDAYFKDTYPLAVLPLVFYHVGQLVVDTFIAEAMVGPRPAGAPNQSAGHETK
jgi:sodium/bile acid cotransporter 7